jgi:hypothetical protein
MSRNELRSGEDAFGPADSFLRNQRNKLIAQIEKSYPKGYPNRDCHEAISIEISRLPVDESWLALNFRPSKRQWIYHPRLTCQFLSLKTELIAQANRCGWENIEDAPLQRLIALKIKIEFGSWLNSQSQNKLRAAVVNRYGTGSKIHRAICSLGSITTRTGDIYALPVSSTTRLALGSMLAALGVFLIFCLMQIVAQIIASNCRSCVVVGAMICIFLDILMAHILWEFGEKRHRSAKYLIGLGIKPYSERPCKRQGDFLDFVYGGALPYKFNDEGEHAQRSH